MADDAEANFRAAQDRHQRSGLDLKRQFGFAARTVIATSAGALFALGLPVFALLLGLFILARVAPSLLKGTAAS
ncbi:MAG TPA: hypothetical protein VMS55_07600 [Myxococcota bacterium]|nr:hypothetical protein [Myxococcota bacterium]